MKFYYHTQRLTTASIIDANRMSIGGYCYPANCAAKDLLSTCDTVGAIAYTPEIYPIITDNAGECDFDVDSWEAATTWIYFAPTRAGFAAALADFAQFARKMMTCGHQFENADDHLLTSWMDNAPDDVQD